jgi:hypothetical protein
MRYPESELYFFSVLQLVAFPVLSNVSDAADHAFTYIALCRAWELGVEFPLAIASTCLTSLSIPAVKSLLKLLFRYLTEWHGDNAVMWVRENHGALTDFVATVLTNSIFNQFVRLQVRTLVALVRVTARAEVPVREFEHTLIIAFQQVLASGQIVRRFAQFVTACQSRGDVDYDEMFNAVRVLLTSANCCLATCDAVFSARRVDSLAQLLRGEFEEAW